MGDVVIALRGVSKSYKLYQSPGDRLKEALHPFKKTYHEDFFALNDISFDIKRGEMVGVLGKNGSGKSTLLKLIARVLIPSSGSVEVAGSISALLELGAGFNPNFTGLQNIYFYGTVLGFSREEMDVKLDPILSFADIGKFIHQPIKTYSSGMRARLAFAVATEVDPEILIIDEVLAVGDMRFAAKCLRRMHEIKEQDKTVILVTHDASKVAVFCDRAIWLKDGAIEAIGEAKQISEIYRDYMVMGTVAAVAEEKAEGTKNAVVEGKKEIAQPQVKAQVVSPAELEVPSVDVDCSSIEWTALSQFPVINKGCGIDITHAALYKAGYKGRITSFERGDRVNLFIKFTSSSDLDRVDIGWVLVDNKGLIACHSNSSFFGKTIHKIKLDNEYIARFEFNVPPLKNGDYILSIGVKIGENVLYKVNDVFVVSILNNDIISLQGGYVILENMNFHCYENI